MATTPNYGWVMPDPTDFVTDLPADFEIFGDAVDATVDGIETIANAAQPNVITTEGDLVVGDASGDPVRLPIGAMGTVLTSDGDTAEWAATSGGSLTLLSTTTLSGTTTSVTGISGAYKNLYIEMENYDAASSVGAISIRLNGLSTRHFGNNARSNSTSLGTVSNNVFDLVSSGHATGTPNFTTMQIFNYASTTTRKTLIGQTMLDESAGGLAKFFGGGFRSDSAITQIDVVANQSLTAGTLRIYGVN